MAGVEFADRQGVEENPFLWKNKNNAGFHFLLIRPAQ